MTAEKQGIERRQFVRIKKNYIIRFFEKNNPSVKFEVSQIENISKGGLCFTSNVFLTIGSNIAIELRTPYIADTIYLEGHLLNSTEKVRGLIYVNHLKFLNVTPEALEVLEKIEKYNSNRIDKK